MKTKFWTWAKLGAVVVIYPLFFLVMPWGHAVSREQAILKRYEVPDDWQWVTLDHAHVAQWKLGLIKDHPVEYYSCLGVLLFALGIFYWGVFDLWSQSRSKQTDSAKELGRSGPARRAE